MNPSQLIRLECLKAALEKRAGTSTAASIVDDARIFASYVQGTDTPAEAGPVPAVAAKQQGRAAAGR